MHSAQLVYQVWINFTTEYYFIAIDKNIAKMNNDDGKFQEPKAPQRYPRGLRSSKFREFPIVTVQLVIMQCTLVHE